jgi:hypothetical protein
VLEDRQGLFQLSDPRQIVVAANWTAVAVSGPIDPATKVEHGHFIRHQDASSASSSVIETRYSLSLLGKGSHGSGS